MLSKSKRLFAVGKLNLTVCSTIPYCTILQLQLPGTILYPCAYWYRYGISLDKTIKYCFMVNFRHTYFWLLESRNIYRYRVHIQRGTRTFSISSLVMVSVSPSL